MGAEFARAVSEDCRPARHERAGGRPTRTSSGCSKASAFLAARVQLKLDAEFPRFTQALLEIVYPHYLAPTPSMLVAQLHPDKNDPNLATRHANGPARHARCTRSPGPTTRPRASSAPRTTSRCWPIEIVSASYFSFAPDLPLNTLPIAQRIKGGLRIRLQDDRRAQVRADANRPPVLLSRRARRRRQQAARAVSGDRARRAGAADRRPRRRMSRCCRRRRSGRSASATTRRCCRSSLRSFQGYRLLQEYFTFPQRYRFIELTGLARGLEPRRSATRSNWSSSSGAAIRRSRASSMRRYLQLFCTPAINLFEKPRVDRIHVSDSTLRVSRRRRSHAAAGFRNLPGHRRRRPRRRRRQRAAVSAVLFVAERRPRAPAAGVFHDAPRAAGDLRRIEAPRVRDRATSAAKCSCRSSIRRRRRIAADLRQLSMQALCTNRDLVLQMPIGLGAERLLAEHRRAGDQRSRDQRSQPAVLGDRRPRDRVARDQPSVAQLPVAGQRDRAAGADGAAGSARAVCDDDRRERAAPDRRHSVGATCGASSGGCRCAGPIAFGRGLEITVDVDEMAFEGGSAFLLGAVLERHFARYVSINSVTETVLRSQSRGEINRWTPNWGTRPTL